MSRNRYTIGVDFGTESARAVLVDVADGRELATAVHQYATGVIDEQLPHLDEDVVLEHDWALQDPANYIASFQVAVPRALAESGVTRPTSSASASTSPCARCSRPRPMERRSASSTPTVASCMPTRIWCSTVRVRSPCAERASAIRTAVESSSS